MYTALRAATVSGIDAYPVEIQVHIASGLPAFHIVGMGDVAVKEARQRVTSALKSCGYRVPDGCITVNLAPALLHKHGTGFDLPIALGILLASKQVILPDKESLLIAGELGLDGSVSPVRGMIAYARLARSKNWRFLTNGLEELEGVISCKTRRVTHLRHLAEAHDIRTHAPASCAEGIMFNLDYRDVVGQTQAVRALSIAAAGLFNVLLIGPPGTGKTMLAARLPGIFPPLSHDEFLETALIHSVAGERTIRSLEQRPFRSPHHSATTVGIIGGGTPIRPGEVSLAHNGVLFLDEMPQFSSGTLQSLRQPLEEGRVRIVRAQETVTLPAHIMLVGAANPCPCGYYGDKERQCHCSPADIQRYQNRIGGPLMDRFDLMLPVVRPSTEGLLEETQSDAMSSEELRMQVIGAREFAERRGGPSARDLQRDELCSRSMINRSALQLLRRNAARLQLSPRALVRVLRVARVIADMAHASCTEEEHLIEALSYRGGWGNHG